MNVQREPTPEQREKAEDSGSAGDTSWHGGHLMARWTPHGTVDTSWHGGHLMARKRL